MRVFFVVLSLIFGTLLLLLGAYYFYDHSSLLINSYSLSHALYILVGLLMISSAIAGMFEISNYSEGFWQTILLTISIIALIGGYFYYKNYTSRIISVQPAAAPQDSSKIYAATDCWTTPSVTIKPNQIISVSSAQPFHLIFGEVKTVPAVAQDGLYKYRISTTSLDFTSIDENSAITRAMAKDVPQFRLTEAATANTADLFIKVEDNDNDKIAQRAINDRFWSLIREIVVAIVIICFIGTGGYFGGRKIYAKYQIRAEEERKQAEVEAELKEQRRQKREEEEAREKAEQEERKADELKRKQAEFAKKIANIDPNSLFED